MDVPHAYMSYIIPVLLDLVVDKQLRLLDNMKGEELDEARWAVEDRPKAMELATTLKSMVPTKSKGENKRKRKGEAQPPATQTTFTAYINGSSIGMGDMMVHQTLLASETPLPASKITQILGSWLTQGQVEYILSERL